MTSYFALEVAKYPKSSYFRSVQACCFPLLVMQLVISVILLMHTYLCWIQFF